MINRRKLITGVLSGLVMAPMVVKAASLMPLRGAVMPIKAIKIESMAENYARFVKTDYLKRMDLAEYYDVENTLQVSDYYDEGNRLNDQFDFINRSVLEFREQ